MFSLNRWVIFWTALWEVCKFPLTVAILVGIVLRLRGRGQPQDVLIFFWVAASYLFTTIVIASGEGNVPRYTMYILPPLALLAAMSVSPAVVGNANVRQVAFALLAMLIGWNIYSGWAKPHPYTAGYQQAAEFVAGEKDTGLILFAGKHDGNFIFHLRALDPERNKAVLRADKILVSMAVHKAFGTVSHVQSIEDVIRLIDRFGVGIVVIESRDVVELPEFKLLAKAVEDHRFQMLKEIPVQTNVPEFSNLSIRIYRYLDKKEQAGDLVIPLPHMGMEIKLKPQRNTGG
jgi:hypothetical protein